MIIKNGKRIDGCSDTVPIGTLNPFLGSIAPYGYLICEGQKVSKTTYKELYEICGDTFGQSTDTEFYLPDLRGQTIAGYKEGDSTFGTLGGLIGSLTHLHSTGNHTLTTDEMPQHLHLMAGTFAKSEHIDKGPYWVNQNQRYLVAGHNLTNIDVGSDSTSSRIFAGDLEDRPITDYTGTGEAHNHGDTSSTSSVQPTIVLNWIVKAFQLMPNQSYVSTIKQDSDINTYSCNYINTILTHSHVRKTINNQSGFTDLSSFTTTVAKDGFAIIQIRLLTAPTVTDMTIKILKNGLAINHSYYNNLPDATELNEQAMIDVKKGDVISIDNVNGKFYGTDLYNTFDIVII